MKQFCVAVCILFLTASVFAQDQVAEPPEIESVPAPEVPAEWTVEQVRALRDALPEGDTAARGLYDEVLARLERARASREAAAAFRQSAASAPALLNEIRGKLLLPATEPTPVVPVDATLAQLEAEQTRAKEALSAARQQEALLLSEATRREDRLGEIQASLASLRQRRLRVESDLSAIEAEPPSTSVGMAREVGLEAELIELRTKIDELEAERTSYEVRRDLLPARRDQASRRVTEADKLASAWQAIVSERRRVEAERSAKEAEQLKVTAARQHPVLREYAERTQELAKSRTEADSIPNRIDDASTDLAEVRSAFSSLQQRYSAVQQRLTVSGLDRATGLMLRREFESLPDIPRLRRRVVATERELEDVEFILFERRDAQLGSGDISLQVEQLMALVDPSESERAFVEAVARDLATGRRDVLASLENDADTYQKLLVELDRESEKLLEAARSYESFIRERILWVRSVYSTGRSFGGDLRSSLVSFADLNVWVESLRASQRTAQRQLPDTIGVAGFLALLILVARWSKRRLADLAGQVSRFKTDNFRHSLMAVLCTLCVSARAPVLLGWLGWMLVRPTDQTDLGIAFGDGLMVAGSVAWPLRFLYVSLLPDGLARAHFRWSAEPIRFLRKQLVWFIPIAVTAACVEATTRAYGDEAAVATVGRIAFTVAMIAGIALLLRVMHPRSPLVLELLGQSQSGWLATLRYVWFPLLVAVPLAFVVASWFGYFYTAIQLDLRLNLTIGLLVVLILTNALLTRWLFLARRRVAVEEARRRREQSLASVAKKRTADGSAPAESSLPPIDEDHLDLPGLSLQTKQLFRTGIWVSALVGVFAIWVDVLPALRMLDRVQVYPAIQIMDVTEDSTIELLEPEGTPRTDAASASEDSVAVSPATSEATPDRPSASINTNSLAGEPGGDESSLSVTVADIGLAIVVLIATLVVFRNLPGLIEIMVLQRLPLDAGSRYALSTVLKYVIAIVGALATFSVVNVSWSHVQWLAAALTFGLAFGLQEIFANFISGLIILAERPIRIGDTVTVGNVSGTVTRIKMRATTITDWDRKELIIPNKTFITGEVINWTLSDAVLRVIVPVGVSYGADVRKAEVVLLEVAKQSPDVLAEPKPYVLFNRFGDSTLDFELRVFIPHVNLVLSVKHDLHMRITEEFRKAGIEIAFPQRDLHIKADNDLRSLIAGSYHEEPAGAGRE